MNDPAPIAKQEGVTTAERYLARLCAQSFLSLWSYPGVYRDQGKRGSGDGKEICDVLVIFGDDLLLFSDKDCQFPCSGQRDEDWKRWFKRAVQKSAAQLWGAERWITENPNRIFVDRRCSQRLPVSLPDSQRRRMHRIVVAHGAAARCRELLGGSGSLLIIPALTGCTQIEGSPNLPDFEGGIYERWAKAFGEGTNGAKTVLPFAVGDLDPHKGFVHVFDEAGLAIVMAELDTISDFVTYLREREAYIRGGQLLFACGEEDLLAHYLQHVDEDGQGSFYIPDDSETKIVIAEGEWEALKTDRSWTAMKQACRASYYWDRVIERFNKFILDGTSVAYPLADFNMQERSVRALARETRVARWILALALADFFQNKRANAIAARVVRPSTPERPYYVFLTVKPEATEDRQQYRARRQAIAYAYLIEAKRRFANLGEVVVLATEMPDSAELNSEDLLYRNADPLTAEEMEAVREYVDDQGVLAKLGEPFRAVTLEPLYHGQSNPADFAPAANPPRNARCPCGSGLKFKHCCMQGGRI
jgi:hypothetical protein